MGRQAEIQTVEHECPSNEELAYRAKQYLTLQQIMDVLLDIENGVITEFPEPHKYLVDIDATLRDMYSDDPTELTMSIFQPTKKIYAISNGVGLTNTHTILHTYNDFISKEAHVLPNDALKARAGMIREVIAPMGRNLMGVLSSYCTNLGVIRSVQ